MTPDAWCGWVAVTAIAEAALNARSARPGPTSPMRCGAAIRRYKSQPLYFDARQQLVQPTHE
jgi:hypothetical protein